MEPIDLNEYLIAIEKGFIKKALKHTGGERTSAAELLGLKRSALVMRLKKFNWLKKYPPKDPSKITRKNYHLTKEDSDVDNE